MSVSPPRHEWADWWRLACRRWRSAYSPRPLTRELRRLAARRAQLRRDGRRLVDAGLEQLDDLRHTYASRALALGESLTTIGGLLGHTKVRTTARYAHLARDTEIAASAKIGASIGAHVLQDGTEPA